ncbi:hypothetical protein RCL_jg7422.t1 [Rhizophagus clarus]|uniref:Uncharacterized protein n=1 Tax=Rhizophagus clarus TaxID=94130 RepID=A0A8H3QHC3_9GLOM|nr:hypothetical protein RCL_jg7422.t1 [Rhizophagus clarus]
MEWVIGLWELKWEVKRSCDVPVSESIYPPCANKKKNEKLSKTAKHSNLHHQYKQKIERTRIFRKTIIRCSKIKRTYCSSFGLKVRCNDKFEIS